MFSWNYLGEGSVTTWGQYMANAGAHKAAVFVISANQTNSEFTKQFIASVRATGTVTVGDTFSFTDATTSMRAVAQKIKDDGID